MQDRHMYIELTEARKVSNAITPLLPLQFDANYVLKLQAEDKKTHIITQNHTEL